MPPFRKIFTGEDEPDQAAPAVGEDVSHLMAGGTSTTAPTAGDPAVGDDVSHLMTDAIGRVRQPNDPSRLPTKPVSAEDFLPSTMSSALRGIPKGVVSALAGMGKLAVKGSELLSPNPGLDVAVDPIFQRIDAATTAENVPEYLAKTAAEFATPSLAKMSGVVGSAVAEAAPGVLSKAAPLASEAAKTIGTELASHYLGGLPFGASTVARVILRSALQGAGKATPEVAADAANVGGKLVAREEPTLEQILTDALQATRETPAPAKITTPPPSDLPAGYQPRTTVPRIVAKPSAPAAPAAASPTRPYFLKSEAQMADEAAASQPSAKPSGSLTIADLPEAWKSRTAQDVIPTVGALGKEVRTAFLQELKDRGLSTGEAIMAVSRNKTLPLSIRAQLLKALGQAPGAQ